MVPPLTKAGAQFHHGQPVRWLRSDRIRNLRAEAQQRFETSQRVHTHPEINWDEEHGDADVLEAQVAEQRAGDADPVVCRVRGGDARGGVERAIERAIGREREEQEDRGDEQEKSHQFVQSLVACWSK